MLSSAAVAVIIVSAVYIIIFALSIALSNRQNISKKSFAGAIAVSMIFALVIVVLAFVLNENTSTAAAGPASTGLIATWESIPATTVFERYVPFTMRLEFNASLVFLPQLKDFQPTAEAVVAVNDNSIDVTVSFDTVGPAIVGMFAQNTARGLLNGKVVKTADAAVQQPINVVNRSDFIASFVPLKPVPAYEKIFLNLICSQEIFKLPLVSEFVPKALDVRAEGTNTLKVFFNLPPNAATTVNMIDPNSMTSVRDERLSNVPSTTFVVYGALDATVTTTQTNFPANVDFNLSYQFTNPIAILPIGENFSVAPVLIEKQDSNVMNVTFNLPANPDIVITLSETDNPCEDIYGQVLTNDVRSQHLIIS